MAVYLGVNAVEANSVRVVSGLPKQRPQLLPGCRLIAVIDDGNYRYAPDLTNSATYNLFTHLQSKGQFHWAKLHFLPHCKVELCPDEGAASSTANDSERKLGFFHRELQIYKTDKDNTEKVQTTLFNYLKSDEITSYAKSICNKIYNGFQIYIEPDDILSMTYLALSTPRRIELLTRDTFDQEKLKLYIMRVVRNAAFKTLKKEKEQKIQISGLRTSDYNFDIDFSVNSDYKDWSGRVRETKEAQRLIDYDTELEMLLQEAPIIDRYKRVLQIVINCYKTRASDTSKKDLMKEIADALGINPDGSHPKVMLHRARTDFIRHLNTINPRLVELFPVLLDEPITADKIS